MKNITDLFWTRYHELKDAVGTADDSLIGSLDGEVQVLLKTIFTRTPADRDELALQMMTAIELLRLEADDRCCVLAHAENLRAVIERHVAGETSVMDGKTARLANSGLPTIDTSVESALLEKLDNRVSVVSTEYRYLYTNALNAQAFSRQPADLLGRHVGEFIGLHRFVQGFKERLDGCFRGEKVDYTYADRMNNRTVVVRCRMSPYYSSAGVMVGALVVAEEIADRRQTAA